MEEVRELKCKKYFHIFLQMYHIEEIMVELEIHKIEDRLENMFLEKWMYFESIFKFFLKKKRVGIWFKFFLEVISIEKEWKYT